MSVFTTETANMISVFGVSGTQNPLESITRFYDNKKKYEKGLTSLKRKIFLIQNDSIQLEKFFFQNNSKLEIKIIKN